MTDQFIILVCRDVHRMAFDFRRGELDTGDTRKVSDHLTGCTACRDYMNRLEGMLDSAATQTVPGVDRDALFKRIVAATSEATGLEEMSEGSLERDRLFERVTLELEGATVAPVVVAAAEDADEEQEERPGVVRRLFARKPVTLYVAAAFAAGILLGVAFPSLIPWRSTTTQPVTEVAEKTAEPVQVPDVEPETAQVKLAELGMQPTPADIRDVRVFGDPNASWNIRKQGARRKLELERGTLLVEFVPAENNELELVADRFTVRVTGTIFYASTDDGVVGVVRGSVEVQTPDGQSIKLIDGQEWADGHGLRQSLPAIRPDVDLLLDVDAHDTALVEAQNAEHTTKRDPPRPALSKEVVDTPRIQLRAAADRALREKRYDVAAQYYERMVVELSAREPGNASLRLDLARIYINHLGQEPRALVHLRTFVGDRPHDPLISSATAEMCRIAHKLGTSEPVCEP